MTEIPPTILIKEDRSLDNAWYRAVSQTMKEGAIIPSNSDGSKLTRDACILFELSGHTIKQLVDGNVHLQAPLQSGQEEYDKQFDYAAIEFEVADSAQPYTYAGRFKKQIEKIHDQGLMVKFSRRIQLCTWSAKKDLGSDEVPCLQLINIRILEGNKAVVTFTWRAHDGFGAWNMNLIALMRFLSIEFPDLEFVMIKEFNVSFHIYEYNWEKALKIRKPTAHDRNFKKVKK
jgi:thymidylate synthase